MGTGVMIGAGIFALTGQVAELAGDLFPIAFLVAAIIVAFCAYSYIKMSNAYPSSGGIVMYLEKAYGPGMTTVFCALLMYFSMVINQSLVARTFGAYSLQLFDVAPGSLLVPLLGVALLVFAFVVNIAGNRLIGTFSLVMAVVKIGAGDCRDSVRCDCQRLRGLARAGHADGDETGAAPALRHARRHSETHPGVYDCDRHGLDHFL